MRSALGLVVAGILAACAPSPPAVAPTQIPVGPAPNTPAPAPAGDVVVAHEEPVRIVSNADEIARYPGEEPLEGKPTPLARDTEVIESPSNPRAKAFAHLTAGTRVTAISRFGAHLLIVFEMSGRTLVGWVPENAISR